MNKTIGTNIMADVLSRSVFGIQTTTNIITSIVVLGLVLGLTVSWIAPNQRTKNLPGPPLAKWTRLWLYKQVHFGNVHTLNAKLHEKYGPVVVLAPNEYSIDDPEAIKIIYGTGSKFTKSDWYAASSPPAFEHINFFVQKDILKHRENRKRMNAYYSMSNLNKYEAFVDNNVYILCERLREMAQAGKSFDLGHWLQCYAFDVITEITFGHPFGFLQKGDDVEGLMATQRKLLKYSARMGIYPKLHYLLAAFLKLDALAPLTAFSIRRVQDRLFGSQEPAGSSNKRSKTGDADIRPEDFLTIFCRLFHERPKEYPFEVVMSMCAMNLTAGSDTTGITLASVLYYLSKYPETQNALFSEVKTMKDGQGAESFTFGETQNMAYLQAVIKEGLRMHPAVGLPLGRSVPECGATISGVYFPAGTVVGVNPWVAHYNKAVFGDDVGVFRPERWLDASPEQLSAMNRYFIPFGSGSRTCIGKNISLMELGKVIPVLISNFEFIPERDTDKFWLKTSCDWFVRPEALKMRIKKRA